MSNLSSPAMEDLMCYFKNFIYVGPNTEEEIEILYYRVLGSIMVFKGYKYEKETEDLINLYRYIYYSLEDEKTDLRIRRVPFWRVQHKLAADTIRKIGVKINSIAKDYETPDNTWMSPKDKIDAGLINEDKIAYSIISKDIDYIDMLMPDVSSDHKDAFGMEDDFWKWDGTSDRAVKLRALFKGQIEASCTLGSSNNISYALGFSSTFSRVLDNNTLGSLIDQATRLKKIKEDMDKGLTLKEVSNNYYGV